MTFPGHLLLLVGLLGLASRGGAAPAAMLRPFLEEHCLDCHDAEAKKGGLNLDALEFGPSGAEHATWVRVFDRVLAGEMPPKKKARPDAGQQRTFLTTLGEGLVTQHRATKGTILRRLNRREYQNTLNDLLGTQVEVMPLLPEDGRAQGFDNIGEALSISGVQMQRYLEAAEVALNAALLAGARPETRQESFTYDAGRNPEQLGKHWLKREDGAVVVFNDGGFPSTQLPGFKATAAGLYRVRVAGYGYQIQEPVPFALISGTFNRGGDQDIRGFYELPPGQSGTVECTLALRAGDGIKISPQGLNGPDGHSPIKDGPDQYPGEGLALQRVEIEGPILTEWPPRWQRLLLGEAPVRELPPEKPWMKGKPGYRPTFTAESAQPAEDARKLLPGFLTQAFRRPVSAADRPRLFEKFTRLTAQPTGDESSNGLGLAIVRLLTRAMSGEVEYQDANGGGAKFVVTLPRLD